MTGELTPHDRVSGVGVVKTKLLAAAAAGMKRAVLSEDNRLDVKHDSRGEPLPVEVVYVRDLDDAIATVF